MGGWMEHDAKQGASHVDRLRMGAFGIYGKCLDFHGASSLLCAGRGVCTVSRSPIAPDFAAGGPL